MTEVLAESARTAAASAARVRRQTFEGGYGWHGDVFGLIRDGIDWLGQHVGSSRSSGDP